MDGLFLCGYLFFPYFKQTEKIGNHSSFLFTRQPGILQTSLALYRYQLF